MRKTYGNLTGQKFGRLTVVGRSSKKKGGSRYWDCLCDCGNEAVASTSDLVLGKIQSCKCLNIERIKEANTTHGMSCSKEGFVWRAMKQRCYNPRCKDYPNYGGRGICMCDEWKNFFEAFYRDVGPIPKGMTIHRIDNDGNYEPNNWKFADDCEQARNRRDNRILTLDEESHIMIEWAEIRGWDYSALVMRKFRGWTDEEALTIPIGMSRKQYYKHLDKMLAIAEDVLK